MIPLALLMATLVAAEILPARLDQPAGPVRFERENDQPDWETLARQKVATASAAELQRLWQSRDLFDGTAVHFTTELSAALKSKMYYLVSTGGVVSLTPRSFDGQVRYEFESNVSTPKLIRIDYTGEMLASLAPGSQAVGGFVFISDQPLHFGIQPVELSSLSVKQASLTYLGQSARVDGGPHLPEIVFASRLTVEPAHEDYLFVRWKPDDSNCEFSFSLLKISADAMEEVKWSAYNCDV